MLVAGTNLLPFRSAKDPQFPVPAVAQRQIEGRVVLFGVGWRRYAAQWDKDSAKTTLRLLSKVYPQSVRDSHTQGLLRELGVESVLTGCPTLWSVPEQLGEFDEGSVVLTITDYSPDSGRDRRLLDWAQRRFRNAVLQPMGPRDAEIAIREYKWDPARVLPYSLADFSKYLIDHRPMFMGTRLHAAIRVMQYGLPAAIVAIDNRAKEMGADFGLHITDGQSSRELDDALVRSQERVPAGLREARSQGAHYLNELTARLAANE